MKNKVYTRRKKITFSLISLFLGLTFAFLVGEIAIRAIHHFQAQNTPIDKLTPHETLGWIAKPNMKFEAEVKDQSGKEYSLNLTTDANGFRQFGDVNSAKKKVFFVGDSFTQAVEVSIGSHYGKLLADSLNFEPFIYGCGGWGNLQEALFLEQWLDEINPDLVVLQFCTNDIINNSFELEQSSFFNNSRMTRPFSVDDEIALKNPAYFKMDGVKRWSKLIPFLVTRLERGRDHLIQNKEQSSEHLMLKEGKDYKPFAEAINQTDAIIKRIKKQVGTHRELLIFSVDHFEPCSKAIEEICQKNGIEYEGAAPYHLENARKNGATIFASDGAHWNEKGHQITAQVLASKISQKLTDKKEVPLPHSE